jgi:hypothetical protein
MIKVETLLNGTAVKASVIDQLNKRKNRGLTAVDIVNIGCCVAEKVSGPNALTSAEKQDLAAAIIVGKILPSMGEQKLISADSLEAMKIILMNKDMLKLLIDSVVSGWNSVKAITSSWTCCSAKPKPVIV